MSVSAPTSAAVAAVPDVGDKWHRKRVMSKLDDRDSVLEEGIQLVEEWDAAVYPFISNLTPPEAPGATKYNDVAATGSDFDLVFAIGGAGCTASSTVTCTVGSESIGSGSITPGTNTITVTVPDMADWTTSPAANDIVSIYLRIDNVLCPVVSLPVCV
jgi:hypothetical protein